MWGKFKEHLTDDARYWYKKWSTWLALAWGTVLACFWETPTWLSAIVNAVPQDVREKTSPVIWIVMSALPVLIANIRQGNIKRANPDG